VQLKLENVVMTSWGTTSGFEVKERVDSQDKTDSIRN
jgi:hypothetical protein